METDLPGGGVNISAVNGRRRWPIGGPPGSGLWWEHRVGGGSWQDDPRWFRPANDQYRTFYAPRTDEICGISGELRPLGLTAEGPITWAGREA